MRRVFIVTLMLLTATALSAQDLSPDKVMARLEKELKSAKTLKIDFTETYAWLQTGTSASVSGTLLLQGEKRFRVETEDQVLVCDGKTVWTYSKADQRLLIDHLGDNEQQMLPRRMLFHMSKDFDVRSSGAAVLDGVKTVHLRFSARNEATLFPKAELWVSTKSWLPVQVIQTDLDDNTTTYRLNLIEKNVEIADDAMTFTAPEGAEVIDMRD